MTSHYTRVKEIGRGGMATVYLAIDEKSKEKVAIKILKKEILFDEEYIRRFFREARIISQLEHPNIIKILESNFSQGDFYIITEYLPKGDLKSYTRLNSPPLLLKLKIVQKILGGLAYAHGKGIIHRDVKPSNILLSETLEPKLCDFGIATALWGQETQLTKTNEMMGTIDYISPEQRENAKSVDFRTDIYSIGVILYEMVTGRKPQGAFLEPRELVTSIPTALNHMILRCLHPIPRERYDQTEGLAQELIKIIRFMEENPGAINYQEIDESAELVEDPTHITTESLEILASKITKGALSERLFFKTKFIQTATLEDEDEIIELLENAEGMLREAIIESLGKIKSKKSCPLLIDFLTDPYYNKIAAKAIGEIECPQAEKRLLEILKTQKEYAYISLIPLGKLKSKKAIKEISKFLKAQTHSWARSLAVESLGMIEDKEIVPVLEKLIQKELDPDVRSQAKKILGRFSNHE